MENNSSLDKLLSMLEPMGIELLANSSLNVSGEPTCFDLVDGLMVCSRTKLSYLLTDLGLLKKKNLKYTMFSFFRFLKHITVSAWKNATPIQAALITAILLAIIVILIISN